MPDTQGNGAPEPFVARYSIPMLLLWAIPSAGMAAVCLPFAIGGLASGTVAGFVLGLAGAAGLLFFGLIGAVQMLRLFDRREQVIVDQRGIYVRSHGEKVIGLRSIKGLNSDAGRLGITLYKPSKYPIERRHRQFIWRINGSSARGFFGDVWIWTNMLDCSQAALVDAIGAHRPATAFEQDIAAIIAANN